jgi:LacI family transcriptional regulator
LGHKRIGFIAGRNELASARERLEAYKAALRDHALPFDAGLVAAGDFEQALAYQATKALLQAKHPPSAIFAANDLSAFGAMEAIREVELTIPKDISVIGFDDIPQASIAYPKLTTVRQPLSEMGRVAAKLLLEQIAKPATPHQHITLHTQLILRDSCQAPLQSKN